MVVFGQEEHAMRKAEGWTDLKPEPGEEDSIIYAIAAHIEPPKRRGRPPNVRPISEVA